MAVTSPILWEISPRIFLRFLGDTILCLDEDGCCSSWAIMVEGRWRAKGREDGGRMMEGDDDDDNDDDLLATLGLGEGVAPKIASLITQE